MSDENEKENVVLEVQNVKHIMKTTLKPENKEKEDE